MVDQLDMQRMADALRRMGWVRFWVQLALGVVVVGVLLFNNIGGRLAVNADRSLGLGPGLSVTTLSFLVLIWSLWQSWLVVRCGRALASPVRPTKGETSRLVKRGLLADLIGLTLAALGYQALAGSLFLQASMQAPGLFGPMAVQGARGPISTYPITSIEMLSVLSNTQVLFAHLIALILSLWILQRIYRRS
jgi:hypothetical protein